MSHKIIIRQLGLQPYERVFLAMHNFTKRRIVSTIDEIWLVQHPRVFTQGKAGKKENLLQSSNIPLIQSDRGGQITYHGPGQQIMYSLLNLKRYNLNIRSLITVLEQIVISTLSKFSIYAITHSQAPGIYVNNKKICSLGLRIQQGCSLHGLALNVSMDLSPFNFINPCGYIGLRMTQVNDLYPGIKIEDIVPVLSTECARLLNVSYKSIEGWDYKKYND